jgi:Excalibur calcium-binding domain
MKKFLILGVIAGFAWFALNKRGSNPPAHMSEDAVPMTTEFDDVTTTFKCDGRTHCTQMSSCAEATFFIKSCPNTKMDGNNDGVPCEKQWCN